VVQAFYRQENVSRKLIVVQNEVNKAIERFDDNGDGVLQFEEFVEMFCLSDSFRFSMPVSARLQVRSALLAEKDERVRDEIMEERQQMIGDATRYERVKTKQLETLVEELQTRLDDKVLQSRVLEDELQDTKEILQATEARLLDAHDEIKKLFASLLEKQNEGNSPDSNNMSSPSSRRRSPSLYSPGSTRSNHGDILGEVLDDLADHPTPRTPKQGELRRKGIRN